MQIRWVPHAHVAHIGNAAAKAIGSLQFTPARPVQFAVFRVVVRGSCKVDNVARCVRCLNGLRGLTAYVSRCVIQAITPQRGARTDSLIRRFKAPRSGWPQVVEIKKTTELHYHITGVYP
jgi:hypothetical protein